MLKEVLMKRDGVSSEEADRQIEEVRGNIMNDLDNRNITDSYYAMEELGLEPDYLMDMFL